MRRRGWKLISAAMAIASMLTFSYSNIFAEYLSAPELISIEPVVPEEVVAVNIDLTVSPTEGLVPLEVTFTCTATAEVHHEDSRWAMPPQGSVEKVIPLYKTVAANITEQPKDQLLKKPRHTYTFTAKAEYGGVEEQTSVTVETGDSKCQELFLAKQQAEQELEDADREYKNAKKEYEKIKKEKDKLKAEADRWQEIVDTIRERGGLLWQFTLKKMAEKLAEAQNEYNKIVPTYDDASTVFIEAKERLKMAKKNSKLANEAYQNCLEGK